MKYLEEMKRMFVCIDFTGKALAFPEGAISSLYPLIVKLELLAPFSA